MSLGRKRYERHAEEAMRDLTPGSLIPASELPGHSNDRRDFTVVEASYGPSPSDPCRGDRIVTVQPSEGGRQETYVESSDGTLDLAPGSP